jgi:hypothetical protein
MARVGTTVPMRGGAFMHDAVTAEYRRDTNVSVADPYIMDAAPGPFPGTNGLI